MKISSFKEGGCSVAGIAVLDILTKNALKDPYFLNFTYEPFCIPPSVIFPTTPSSSTSTATSTTLASTTATTLITETDHQTRSKSLETFGNKLLMNLTLTTSSTKKKEILNKETNDINKKPRNPRNSRVHDNGVSKSRSSFLLTLVSTVIYVFMFRVT